VTESQLRWAPAADPAAAAFQHPNAGHVRPHAAARRRPRHPPRRREL